MEKRRKRCAPGRRAADRGAATTGSGRGLLSTPILAQNAPLFKTHGDQAGGPPRAPGLLDDLERARAAYWQAYDRHDYHEADLCAIRYRAALRRVYFGPALDDWLRHFGRVLAEQDARLDALEAGEVLGQGGER